MNWLQWSQWQDALAHCAWPWAWWLVPSPLLMWFWPQRRADAAALRVPYAEQLQAVAQAKTTPSLRMPRWLAWLGWFLLCAALARPQQLGEVIQPPREARQMMLAVDLSGSMNEPDMVLGGKVVDRLTAAKAVLSDFLDRRDGDRVGLLVFGQRAYALTPLTADLTSVRDQLRDSVVGLAGRETAIGDAIALSVKRLREQKQGQRVVVLLTDGVNTAGVLDPLKAAELAKAEGVRIHTIAFGGGGGYSLFGVPIPAGGNDDIDEDGLRKIAQQTGGRFFRARDTEELAGIYAELDRLEPVKGLGPSVQPRVERYYWPLGAAIVIALLAYVLPRRWR
ncbi:vWA domain-containing protein [Xanthomonas oryzae]|uniref:VWA domain-containing protein n=1 Tax=Xanthomonas oryzae pv. oryzae TaxID=64187 RepID=A0AAJ5MA29_XANOO|nr:VWA domain-containing protein [Xanthomonas oryzae]OLI45858.1 von Willebrand factor A [Xanthomonas oryzae pv. oryzae]OLI91962.1 von Willebrand factor A [Xanthomonas oryzae pv. oryzae]OLI98385.1 von Willebrand factor A [Xanthomonas oryzae pv. oryzae]OLK23861.1 von Willebrand factor A [Xanthomonas oryzae pv. oryzae]OLK46882.1 von Willebrand factor A [Xanthomonas oryzae pv. oryzae]